MINECVPSNPKHPKINQQKIEAQILPEPQPRPMMLYYDATLKPC